MSDKVVDFPGNGVSSQPDPHRIPQPEVIELLEGYLARARSGDLQAVAVAGALWDGRTSIAYECPPGTGATHLLAAAVGYLGQDYFRGAYEALGGGDIA